MKPYVKPTLRTAAAYGHVRLVIELPARKDATLEIQIAKICEQVNGCNEEGTLEEHVVFEVDADLTFDIIQGEETELDRDSTYAQHTGYADTVQGDAGVDIFDYDAVEAADITSSLQSGAD